MNILGKTLSHGLELLQIELDRLQKAAENGPRIDIAASKIAPVDPRRNTFNVDRFASHDAYHTKVSIRRDVINNSNFDIAAILKYAVEDRLKNANLRSKDHFEKFAVGDTLTISVEVISD